MRNALLLAAALAVAACSTSRPVVAPEAAETEAPAVRRPEAPTATAPILDDSTGARLRRLRVLDSVTVHTPPTGWQKLLGKVGLGKKPGASTAIGKKSTVNYYYGPATVSTTTVDKKGQLAQGDNAALTNTGKKSGPAAINSDSAALSTNGANSQQTVVGGHDNRVDAKKQDTTREAPGPLAVIADNFTSWVPWVLGGGALVVAFVLWRKRKSIPV